MRSLFRSFVELGRGRDKRRPAGDGGQAAFAKLIVGLGNPGKEWANNRHNVGFWCVNRLARRAALDFGRRSGLASVAEGAVCDRRVALAKPRTFVNNSGDAVRELMRRFRLQPHDLIVICDDLDLPLGALRIRERGGHGGHNGLRSIIATVASEDFARIRIGIGRPSVHGIPTRDPERIAAYVLADPPAGERQDLDACVEKAADAVELMLTDGVGRAMAQFNSVAYSSDEG